MAVNFNVYDKFLENEAEGVVGNIATATVTAHLTDRTPVPATDDELADISEIATGGGYTNGTGLAVAAPTSSSLVSNGYEWKGSAKIELTASGTVAQFRYLVLCFSAVSGDPLWGYFDLGVEVNLTNGSYFYLDLTNVVLYRKARAA